MRLFLSSQAISNSQLPAFMELLDKSEPQDIRIALIENAAFGEPGEKPWLYENRAAIQAHGFDVELVDLEDYKNMASRLEEKLLEKDAVWLGGGNTYYLRWVLRETGADEILKELVRGNRLVFGGGSAGAVVAGPTTEFFETADDPKSAPELILSGLSLTDTVVVPHYGNEQYGHVMKDIENKLNAAGYKSQAVTDDQALVINGDIQKIVPA